jgi:hypothetical protein
MIHHSFFDVSTVFVLFSVFLLYYHRAISRREREKNTSKGTLSG